MTKPLTEREARLASIKPVDLDTTAVYLGKLLIGYVSSEGGRYVARDADGVVLGSTARSFALAKDLVTRRPFDLNAIEW